MKFREAFYGRLYLYPDCLLFHRACNGYTRSGLKLLAEENASITCNIASLEPFRKVRTDNSYRLFIFKYYLYPYAFGRKRSEGNLTGSFIFGRKLFNGLFLPPDVIADGETESKGTYNRSNTLKEVFHRKIVG